MQASRIILFFTPWIVSPTQKGNGLTTTTPYLQEVIEYSIKQVALQTSKVAFVLTA
jgi:hypothetical protein